MKLFMFPYPVIFALFSGAFVGACVVAGVVFWGRKHDQA
jgi:hypothetical protein